MGAQSWTLVNGKRYAAVGRGEEYPFVIVVPPMICAQHHWVQLRFSPRHDPRSKCTQMQVQLETGSTTTAP